MWQSWTQLLFPLEIDGQFLGRLTLKIIQLKSNQGEEEETPFSSKMLSNLLDNPHQLIVSHCCPYLVPENWISNKKKGGTTFSRHEFQSMASQSFTASFTLQIGQYTTTDQTNVDQQRRLCSSDGYYRPLPFIFTSTFIFILFFLSLTTLKMK
jgi:hypothetical protein